METIARIDRGLYGVVSRNIDEDDVIITNERIEHIKERHPGDWEKYAEFLNVVIIDPDIILGDDNPFTAISIRKIVADNDEKYMRATIRLHVYGDEHGRRNSVLSYQKINKKEFGRLSRNKNVLYRKDKV